MLRVGLTGGIGSGKSTVSRRLVELGAVLIDADVIAREVVAAGTPGLAAVAKRFGGGVLTEEGVLDRPALGAIVFADDGARRDLEAITHPLVAARTRELEAEALAREVAGEDVSSDPVVLVHDVPLLVEKRMQDRYDLVVVVEVEGEERVRRLVARGHSEVDARARMAHQASDEERRRVADVVLDNNGTAAELVGRVDDLWREVIVPRARASRA